MGLSLQASGLSHVGVVRSSNQDSGFVGQRLLVMADGMGGHAGGDIASATAVHRIEEFDRVQKPKLSGLEDIILTAQRDIVDRVAVEPVLSGMGTTISALMLDDDALLFAHIGDSRVYRLREGQLRQVSKDHTFVQHLIDSGRLDPADAEKHPQRSVLLRVLGDVEGPAVLDLEKLPAVAGDRWLLCSDGLSGVVDDDVIFETLRDYPNRDDCAQELIDLAVAGGGPDNITAIIADVVDSSSGDEAPEDSGRPRPFFLGSAEHLADVVTANTDAMIVKKAAQTLGVADNSDTDSFEAIQDVDPADDSRETETAEESDAHNERLGEAEPAQPVKKRGKVRRFFRGMLLVLFLILLVAGGLYAGWRWTQTQWFVADEEGKVGVFRGIPQDIGPWPLYDLEETSRVTTEDLPAFVRQQLKEDSVPANDLNDARRIIDDLQEQADR